MKHLIILLAGGAVLTVAAALVTCELQAAEQDKPARETEPAESPEAGKRDPAPEAARDREQRGPRDRGPRDRGPRERGPRDGGPRERGPMDRGPEGRGPVRGPNPWRFPLMVALDKDRDGELSAKEIENAVAALKKLDKNEDGKLTPEELRPQFGGPGGPGGPGFGGPGFGGPPRPEGDRPRGPEMAERLMRMDANGDGKVTKDEMPERMQRMLERLDTNGDEAIDKEEAKQAAERFRRSGDRPRGDRAADGDRGPREGGDRPRRPERPDQE